MLINKIKNDMWAAKKSGEKEKASLLNTLYGEASKIGKDAGNRESTDAEVTATIKKFLKGIEESLDAFSKGSFPIAKEVYLARIEKLTNEQTILNDYLPKQLTESELLGILTDHRNTKLAEVGEMPTMGEYMKLLKDHHAGLYDGRLASEIAKTL